MGRVGEGRVGGVVGVWRGVLPTLKLASQSHPLLLCWHQSALSCPC